METADAEASATEKPKLFKRVSSSVQNFKNVPDNYDPFDPKMRMEAPGSISVFEAFVHLMKGSLGTGILAMAHAFTFIGMLAGFIGTVILICILGHCVHLILRCQYFQCKRWGTAFIEYPDCMEDAFKHGPPFCRKLAPAMPYIADFLIVSYQISVCTIYIIYMGQNLQQVAANYGLHLHERVWMCIILVPIMIINLIRDLHYLAPVSTAGNIAFAMSMVVIYYYLFGYDGSAFDNIKDRPLVVWPPTRWPLFIGTACFALESVAIIVKIEHHMREPKKFRSTFGVFNVGIVVTSILFGFTGLIGYMKYGEDSQSSITLNIASDQILAQVVKLLYGLVIFFSYPLQNFVPLELLWVNYIKQHMTTYSEKKKLVVEYIFRELIVIITWSFALIIPHLDLLISLFGAFCLASLGIIFPAVIHILVVRHERLGYGFMNWVLIKDICLIVFGLFVMITGTVISVMDIIAAIRHDMGKSNMGSKSMMETFFDWS